MKDASAFLKEADKIMIERGKVYDKGDELEKERSMNKTVIAFKAITGKELTDSEGWLFMLLLKQVRQWSVKEYHEDSAIDSVSYSALLAESLEEEGVEYELKNCS